MHGTSQFRFLEVSQKKVEWSLGEVYCTNKSVPKMDKITALDSC